MLSKCVLKGSKHVLIFLRVALPHRYLAHWLFNPKTVKNISKSAPNSQKWHDSLNRKWMRPRNVGAARATLTCENSEWSRKFEEPWQEGWGRFFSKAALKGLPRPFKAAGWRCS